MLSERSQANEYILYDSIYIIQSSKTVTADQWLSEGREIRWRDHRGELKTYGNDGHVHYSDCGDWLV